MSCAICGKNTSKGSTVCDACKIRLAPREETRDSPESEVVSELEESGGTTVLVEQLDTPSDEEVQELVEEPTDSATANEETLPAIVFIDDPQRPSPAEEETDPVSPLAQHLTPRMMKLIILVGVVIVILAILLQLHPWTPRYHPPTHVTPIPIDQMPQ